MKRAWSALSVSVIAATCSLGISATPASAAPASAADGNYPCGTTAQDWDPLPLVHFSDYPGVVNIRTGTSSQCSITGTVDRVEAINFHCFVIDAINRTWTYLNTSSGDQGWVLDTSLPWKDSNNVTHYGSQVRCPSVIKP